MRDVALNLFWVNRFAMTMYEKVPTRWRDVPRTRGDIFLPVVQPWLDKESKVAAVEQPSRSSRRPATRRPRTGSGRCCSTRSGTASTTPARWRRSGRRSPQALQDPTQLTFQLGTYDPDYPVFSYADIVDCQEDVAELEALHRWAMVLHNQYPWDRADVRLTALGDLQPTTMWSSCSSRRTRRSTRFLHKVTKGAPRASTGTRVASYAPEVVTKQPIRPYPAVDVRKQFKVLPKIEALAVVRGEILCSNDDLIRNTAYCWSPMTADEISYKTGIETRMYTERGLDELVPGRGEGRAAAGRPAAGGDRRGHLLLLHQPPVDAVDGDLALRPAGHVPDPHVGRHHRRLRRPALRAVRGASGCCRRSTGRCCWSAGRSSPTRSAPSGRPG